MQYESNERTSRRNMLYALFALLGDFGDDIASAIMTEGRQFVREAKESDIYQAMPKPLSILKVVKASPDKVTKVILLLAVSNIHTTTNMRTKQFFEGLLEAYTDMDSGQISSAVKYVDINNKDEYVPILSLLGDMTIDHESGDLVLSEDASRAIGDFLQHSPLQYGDWFKDWLSGLTRKALPVAAGAAAIGGPPAIIPALATTAAITAVDSGVRAAATEDSSGQTWFDKTIDKVKVGWEKFKGRYEYDKAIVAVEELARMGEVLMSNIAANRIANYDLNPEIMGWVYHRNEKGVVNPDVNASGDLDYLTSEALNASDLNLLADRALLLGYTDVNNFYGPREMGGLFDGLKKMAKKALTGLKKLAAPAIKVVSNLIPGGGIIAKAVLGAIGSADKDDKNKAQKAADYVAIKAALTEALKNYSHDEQLVSISTDGIVTDVSDRNVIFKMKTLSTNLNDDTVQQPSSEVSAPQEQVSDTSNVQVVAPVFGKVVLTSASGNLNLRSEPNSTSTILGKLPNGSAIQLLDTTSLPQWYLVQTQFGQGYVSSAYVKQQ